MTEAAVEAEIGHPVSVVIVNSVQPSYSITSHPWKTSGQNCDLLTKPVLLPS